MSAARRYLDAGDLGSAVEVAQAAAAASPTDSQAQLVAALALSRVRLEAPDRICELGAWTDAIEAHVQAAWAFDGGLIQRLSDAPDLRPLNEALYNSVALKVWPSRGRGWKTDAPPKSELRAGLPVRHLDGVLKRKVAARVVPDTLWYAVTPDGVATRTVLALHTDGVALRTTLERDADGQDVGTTVKGTWRLDKSGLHLDVAGEPRLLSPRVTGLVAVQDAQGRPLAEPPLRFWDRPLDCPSGS